MALQDGTAPAGEEGRAADGEGFVIPWAPPRLEHSPARFLPWNSCPGIPALEFLQFLPSSCPGNGTDTDSVAGLFMGEGLSGQSQTEGHGDLQRVIGICRGSWGHPEGPGDIQRAVGTSRESWGHPEAHEQQLRALVSLM